VWWLRLGIGIERIKPGHPQQNGRHQRMHLTLKKEATKPASFNFLQQQSRFDEFIEVWHALPGDEKSTSARSSPVNSSVSPRSRRKFSLSASWTGIPS
jgi:transposase InsO family protein